MVSGRSALLSRAPERVYVAARTPLPSYPRLPRVSRCARHASRCCLTDCHGRRSTGWRVGAAVGEIPATERGNDEIGEAATARPSLLPLLRLLHKPRIALFSSFLRRWGSVRTRDAVWIPAVAGMTEMGFVQQPPQGGRRGLDQWSLQGERQDEGEQRELCEETWSDLAFVSPESEVRRHTPRYTAQQHQQYFSLRGVLNELAPDIRQR